MVSKLVYNLFRGRIQPTYIGVITQLLSTMDIQVVIQSDLFIAGSEVTYCNHFYPKRGHQQNCQEVVATHIFF